MNGVDGDTPSSHPLKGWYLIRVLFEFSVYAIGGVKSNAGYYSQTLYIGS